MPTPAELVSEALAVNNLADRLPDAAPHRSNELIALHKHLTEIQVQGFRPFWDPNNQRPNDSPIIIDYINDTTVDACAIDHNNQYFITINYGTLFTLRDTFNYLLSTKDFLPSIGDTNAERNTLPPLPLTYDYNDIETTLAIHHLAPDDLIPRDPTRQGVARFLTDSAIRFLSAHEFRHIQGGHLAYGANNFSLSYLSERVTSVASGVAADRMKDQAMECDADKFAIEALLALHWRTRNDALRNPAIYAPIYQDPKLLFFLSFAACSILFKLFDHETPPPSDWSTYDHPPARNRRLILLMYFFVTAECLDPATFNDTTAHEIAKLNKDHLEIVVSGLFGNHYDASYWRTLSQHAEAHRRQIVAAWNSMSADLQRYSYVPLGSIG